ncbi:DUF222 domain-containing protein [Aeromicrobium sp.]|uniref:HNH endonuclease signature motif containing protein n=1 Tax=Aeromicrobium sp. TaxID=1871063 RepID=UPI0030BC1A7A
METVVDPGNVLLAEIAELEVQRARVEAQVAAKMLLLQDLRRAGSQRHVDPRRRDLEAGFAADELGVVLHLPTKTVQDRLAQSRRVRNLLPRTWESFVAGEVDAYRIGLVAAAAAKLGDNHDLIHLDHIIGGYAAAHTPAQLRGKLKRFVARWAPNSGSVRAEQAKRSVWVDHQDDGMSFLHAYLPTTDALRIDAMLNDRARAVSDDRTFDQRRADELVGQLLGHIEGRPTSSRAVIGVTVPVTTLAGLDDQPGESFDGSFALPADLVRDLATEPGTLFHRVITDPLGRILDVTELERFPSAKLGTAIDIRDGTCRFATCSRPAMQCDADHQIPHPRGPTTGTNLRALCRRHHRMKTARVAEPTDLAMRTRTGSRREAELAHFTLKFGYAA